MLEQAGCDENERYRIDTRQKVRVKSVCSAEFAISVGCPQGDMQSLPSAIHMLPSCGPVICAGTFLKTRPPVSAIGMPLEMEYAHDVDFRDEEKDPLETHHYQSPQLSSKL